MKDSHSKISSGKGSSSAPMDHGTNRPLLFWIDCKVESTANKREHPMARHRRNAAQKQAVQRAVANLEPPGIPDERDPTL